MDIRQRTRLALDALVLKDHSYKLVDLMVLHIPLAPRLHMACAVQRRAAASHDRNAVSQASHAHHADAAMVLHISAG